VRQKVAVPWIHGGKNDPDGIERGLALTHNPGMPPESLIDAADLAMYRAKMQRILPRSEP
jgi:PleD family two-component response regulator